jgi:hypothetical protein
LRRTTTIGLILPCWHTHCNAPHVAVLDYSSTIVEYFLNDC